MISLPIFRGAVSNAADVPSLDLNFSGPSGFFAEKGATPTLTRGSVATYTDSAGVLRTTNSNLLLQSNNFTDAYWSKTGVTLANAVGVNSPDGSTNATLITATNATADGVYRFSSGPIGGTYSIYIKRNVGSYISIWTSSDSGSACQFNILTNTIVVLGVNNESASVTPINNGWVRLSVSRKASTASGNSCFFAFLPPPGGQSAAVGDNHYIYGAQMEEASYAGPYSPTTTAATNNGPRIDYDPVTLACKGLLIEEARTNLLSYSNTFSDASWIKTSSILSQDGTISPDSTASAWKFMVNGTGTKTPVLYKPVSTTANTAYCFSVFAKKGNFENVSLDVETNNSTAWATAVFNLNTNANGVATQTAVGSTGSSTILSTNSQYVGNGWYRVSVVCSFSTSGVTPVLQICPQATGNAINASWGEISFIATGTEHAYFYGAQFEVGTFPTSYIPTTTASVTRNIESCYLNGTNFSSWFNSSEGTFVVEARAGAVSSFYTTILVASDGGTLTNNINIVHQDQVYAAVWSGSSLVAGNTIGNVFSVDTLFKSSIAYKVNDFAFCYNGETVSTDTLGAIPVGINQLLLANGYSAGAGTSNTKVTISRVRYYNKRLANSRLQQRTSPTTLDWRSVGPVHWPNYKASITNTIATGTVTDATVEGGGTYAGGNKFIGGLLLPDGRVFCNPFAVLYGSIYDPVTNSFTDTPSLIAGLYHNLGSVLLKNGNIYLIPSQGGITGVVYNPITNTILTAPTGAATAPTNGEAYCGGVVMQDGRVFCVPSGATVARIYNPLTNVLESPSITNGSFPGVYGSYAGGVLLADGRVFLIPRTSTIGKIYNPVTNTITDTGNSVAATTEKYLGGVLMPNGKVFCVPLNSTVAKIYDPATNLFEPDITGFGPGLLGGVLLPNGNIFCGAHASTGSPKIYNPSTGAITTAAGSYGVSYGWGGTVLMNDGRVFCIPFAATKSKIYGGGGGFNTNIYLSAYYNKL